MCEITWIVEEREFFIDGSYAESGTILINKVEG